MNKILTYVLFVSMVIFTLSCEEDVIETEPVFLWSFYDYADGEYPYENLSNFKNYMKLDAYFFFFKIDNLTRPMIKENDTTLSRDKDLYEYNAYIPIVIKELDENKRLLLEDGSFIVPTKIAKELNEEPSYSYAKTVVGLEDDWASFSDNLIFIEPGDYYVVVYSKDHIGHFAAYRTDGKYTATEVSINQNITIKTVIPADDCFKGYYDWPTIEWK